MLFTFTIGNVFAEEETFTVTFDTVYEGLEVLSQTVEAGGLVIQPEDPTFNYRAFKGWFKDSDHTEPWDFQEDTVEEDLTIYAAWGYSLLSVETDGYGSGEVEVVKAGEKMDFDEEHDTSFYTTIPGEYTLGARADEGSKFVGWNDGEGNLISTEPEITVTLQDPNVEEESLMYKAVFTLLPWNTATLELRHGTAEDMLNPSDSVKVFLTLMLVGELNIMDEPPEMYAGLENLLTFFSDAEGKFILMFSEERGCFYYGPDAINEEGLAYFYHEITDEERDLIQFVIDEDEDSLTAEEKEYLQDLVDNDKAVELIFIDPAVLTVNTNGAGYIAVSEKDDPLYGDFGNTTSIVTSGIGIYRVEARAAEPDITEDYRIDHRFVKWTLDGKDYSTEPVIFVELWDDDIDLVAVFESDMQVFGPSTETEPSNTDGSGSTDGKPDGGTDGSAGGAGGKTDGGTDGSSGGKTDGSAAPAKSSTAPATGDTSDTTLYILLLAAGLFGISLLGSLKRTRR